MNFFDEFSSRFMNTMQTHITRFIVNTNKRCSKYEKSSNTQAKAININFQSLVGLVTTRTLLDMNIECYTGVCENISDHSFEWDSGILQIDAKGTQQKDGDFKLNRHGFKIRCGVAQTTLVSSSPFTNRKTGIKHIQKGLQLPEIDSKPVYTMVSFMRWGYGNSNGYYIDSYGITNVPHDYDHIDFVVGKAEDEMRIVFKNPALWKIVQVSSGSSPQTQGSVPSEGSESEDVEQLDP
jgi:hypothetical protein